MDVPARNGAEMRVGASIRKPLIIIAVTSTRKHSQIFGSEEPNLIAIRTKSSDAKIWLRCRADL